MIAPYLQVKTEGKNLVWDHCQGGLPPTIIAITYKSQNWQYNRYCTTKVFANQVICQTHKAPITLLRFIIEPKYRHKYYRPLSKTNIASIIVQDCARITIIFDG